MRMALTMTVLLHRESLCIVSRLNFGVLNKIRFLHGYGRAAVSLASPAILSMKPRPRLMMDSLAASWPITPIRTEPSAQGDSVFRTSAGFPLPPAHQLGVVVSCCVCYYRTFRSSWYAGVKSYDGIRIFACCRASLRIGTQSRQTDCRCLVADCTVQHLYLVFRELSTRSSVLREVHGNAETRTGNENLQKLGSGEDQVLGVTSTPVPLSKRLSRMVLYGAVTQAPVANGRSSYRPSDHGSKR